MNESLILISGLIIVIIIRIKFLNLYPDGNLGFHSYYGFFRRKGVKIFNDIPFVGLGSNIFLHYAYSGIYFFKRKIKSVRLFLIFLTILNYIIFIYYLKYYNFDFKIKILICLIFLYLSNTPFLGYYYSHSENFILTIILFLMVLHKVVIISTFFNFLIFGFLLGSLFIWFRLTYLFFAFIYALILLSNNFSIQNILGILSGALLSFFSLIIATLLFDEKISDMIKASIQAYINKKNFRLKKNSFFSFYKANEKIIFRLGIFFILSLFCIIFDFKYYDNYLKYFYLLLIFDVFILQKNFVFYNYIVFVPFMSLNIGYQIVNSKFILSLVAICLIILYAELIYLFRLEINKKNKKIWEVINPVNINLVNGAYKIGQYIKQNADETERIFVFGNCPQIYILSERMNISKHFYTTESVSGIQSENWQKEIINDIIKNNPKFIIDMERTLNIFEIENKTPINFQIKKIIDNYCIYEIKKDNTKKYNEKQEIIIYDNNRNINNIKMRTMKICDYFKNNNTTDISVYGTSETSKEIIKIFLNNGIKIKYIISKDEISEFNGIKVIKPSNLENNTDIIVITTRGYQLEIYDELKRKYKLKNEIYII